MTIRARQDPLSTGGAMGTALLRRAGVVAGVCLAAAGFAAPAIAATAPSGYQPVKLKAAGISIVLPDTWEVSKTTRAQAQEMLDRNPQLGFTVDDLIKNKPLTATWYAEDGDQSPDRWMDVTVLAESHVLPSPAEIRSELGG